MNDALHTFVRDALARGATREAISAALHDARWPDDEIESALSAWHDAGLGLPVPRRRVGVSPREAFLYLLLFVALYLVAYNVGAILFAWIERIWPDAAFSDPMDEQRREWVRFGVASLIVAFPVYLLTARITGRAVARDPEKRNSGVRRWLTYLTLFNAACVLIGDFIVVLQGFLKGELTLRFTSKAAVVAAIAGWLFTHYMGGLRRDEGEGPRLQTPSWLARAVGVVVVIVVLLGLRYAGAPAIVRHEMLDQRRVDQLGQLSQHIFRFQHTFSRLPRGLDEMSQLPAEGMELSVRDPVTQAMYGYEPIDSVSFRLCASFDAANPSDAKGLAGDPFWRHGAGRSCFTFRVPGAPGARPGR